MKKVLLLSLLLISNLMAGWMNVDSINVKHKWRNKKLNTDALLFVKSSDSLLDTCNIYSKSGLIGIATDAPVEPLTVAGDIWLYKNKGIILRGDDDAGYSSAIYMSTDEGLGADAYWGKLASIQCNAGKACFTFMAKDSTFTDLDDPTGYSYDTIMSINNHAGINSVIIGNSTDHFYNPAVLHVIGDVKVDSGLTVDGKCSFDTLLLDSLYVSGGTHLNGKLGVGTNNPSAQLDVIGTSEFNGLITVNDNINMGSNFISNDGSNTGLTFIPDFVNSVRAFGFYSFADSLLEGLSYPCIYSTGTGGAAYPFTTAGNLIIQGRGTANRDIIFANGTTPAINMTIEYNGEVGIGTSHPQGRLHIYDGPSGITPNGTANELIIEDDSYAGISLLTPNIYPNQIYFGNATDNIGAQIQWVGQYGFLQIGTDTSLGQIIFNAGDDVEAMRIDENGNVGIGTNDPQEALHIRGSGGTFAYIESGSNGRTEIIGKNDDLSTQWGVGSTDGTNCEFWNYQNGYVRFGTNASEMVRIDTLGNVGVSTDNPLSKFDVSYSVNTDTPTICFGADGTFGSTSRTTSTIKRGAFGLVHYDLTEEPIAALYAYSESGVNNVVIGGGSSALNAATYLRFYTGATATTISGSEAMTINSSGNVGIGNTLPGYKLTVNGIARSSTVHTDSVYVNDDRIRIANSNTPASASAAGTAGTICWDANYIYVCIATDTWKRTAISTW